MVLMDAIILYFCAQPTQSEMKELVASFTAQLRQAVEIGEKATFTPSKNPIRNVLITGLGGSGIGGSIINQIVEHEIKVPITVNKDYFIPAFVGPETLVIVSSYSGNTEETLGAMEIAMSRGAKMVCVTSGGKVLEIAKTNGFDHIIIPGGMPPRACLAYSFTQLFYVLHGFGLISNSFKADFETSIHLLDHEEEHICSEAYYLAEKLHKKIPVIYSQANFEAVCIRFRQQINENSKMLCWHHALPEMNHNELVGWTIPNDKLAVVFFRNETDYDRTKTRMELTKEIVKKYTPYIFEVYSKGATQLQRSLYLIHFGDWVSWYISEIRNIDATEVKVIDFLKGELSKI
ncbi:MAG: bifunctional phosphoglucose/phosphomannose isomerase [Bacteroidetes bacterium ADurb.Bin397]|nr:MAG: bifunctional phosphoglucose/phosphomannose isomerase [Bacteroidetes bacterium ADurb.Bin397]